MRFKRLLQAISMVSVMCSGFYTMAQSVEEGQFARIDAHALSAPPSAEASIPALAKYLIQPAQNDTEKARAIYRWVTDRIDYDIQAYFHDNAQRMSAETLLSKRSSVCEGYATLFEVLSKEAGLEVVSISGYVKGYSHREGKSLSAPNHAWNAVKINGKWRLIDSTWGAGYVRDGGYKKVFSEIFFLASPEQLMFSHFPEKENWQFQSTPHLKKAEFEALPTLDESFFNLGISGEAIWNTIKAPNFKGEFVYTYGIPYKMAVIQKAPLTHQLEMNQIHDFKIESDKFEKIVVVHNNVWTDIPNEGHIFTTSVMPKEKGELRILGKKPDAENYTVILAYNVE